MIDVKSRYAPRPAAATLGSRVAVVALLASAVVLFSEEDAWAETQNFFVPIYYIVGGSAAGAASIPFLVADVVYTVEHRWLPPRWAIAQIVIGGGVNAAVAVWGMSEEKINREQVLPLVIGTTVLSVGFIAHGVASLILYEPPIRARWRVPTASDSNPAAPTLRWVPDIVVTQDGKTFVAFSGVF